MDRRGGIKGLRVPEDSFFPGKADFGLLDARNGAEGFLHRLNAMPAGHSLDPKDGLVHG
jgi:hypothetical protein